MPIWEASSANCHPMRSCRDHKVDNAFIFHPLYDMQQQLLGIYDAICALQLVGFNYSTELGITRNIKVVQQYSPYYAEYACV